MNTFTLVAVFSALVLAISASAVKNEKDGYPVIHGYNYGEKCPAKFFYDDCNFCYCGPDGFSAACTLKACNPDHQKQLRSSDSVLPHNDFYSETNECTPGKGFYDRCNICRCFPDGKNASCTKMNCRSLAKPHIDGYKQGQKCPAGKAFFDERNSCTCGPDGISAACTLMECGTKTVTSQISLPSLPHIDNFNEVQECTAGQYFYDKCNACYCSPDGKSAACTMMSCTPVNKPRIDDYVSGKKCPAGKAFYERCNTCHCFADGVSAVCTYMLCPGDD